MTLSRLNPADSSTPVAASPLAGMKRTAKFVHAPENRKTISFDGLGRAARTFILILAAAGFDGAPAAGGEAVVRPEENGIAVIDADTKKIVLEMAYPQISELMGPSPEQERAFRKIGRMNWSEFATFLERNPGYRGGVDEIDGPTAPAADLRDDFLKELDAAGEYSFPLASRAGMIAEILGRPRFDIQRGAVLCWDVRMKHRWDQSGVLEGEEEVCRTMDARWKAEIKSNPNVLDRAAEIALDSYVHDEFEVLSVDEARCSLSVLGANGGFIGLDTFAGHDMTCRSDEELAAILASFTDEEVRHLWMATRVLDVDFSTQQRTFAMQLALNQIRASMEDEWLMEREEALAF